MRRHSPAEVKLSDDLLDESDGVKVAPTDVFTKSPE